MADQMRWKWRQIVEAPENQALFAPYRRAVGEPRTLFEAIGEKLGSSREEERAHAFSAFYLATPELAEILYERESRQAGYRSGSGEGPRLLNQGMDVVTYLYLKLVEERQFKADAKRGMDPRPYVRRTMKNWQIDEARRWKGIPPLSLDGVGEEDASLLATLHDPAVSTEADAIEPLFLEETRRELQTWASLDDGEVALFEALCANDWALEQAAATLGIPSPAAGRKRLQRFRSKLLATRDSILSSILSLARKDERLPQSIVSEWAWEHRLEAALRPGPWAAHQEGMLYQRDCRIRPLTRSFRGGIAYLYVGVHQSDYPIPEEDQGRMFRLFANEFFDWRCGQVRSTMGFPHALGSKVFNGVIVEDIDQKCRPFLYSIVPPNRSAHPAFLDIRPWVLRRSLFGDDQEGEGTHKALARVQHRFFGHSDIR
jgi:DNA-directed RNA polymerase specialized sigma24 family protein